MEDPSKLGSIGRHKLDFPFLFLPWRKVSYYMQTEMQFKWNASEISTKLYL